MATQPNETVELTVVQNKYAAQSTPSPEEYVNRAKSDKTGSKRPQSRKRCCTLVVLVLLAIGAGTFLLYEYLLGWHPAESNGLDTQPEVARSSFKLPGLGNRGPQMADSSPGEASRLASTTTTQVIFIDSTTSARPQTNGSTERMEPDKSEEQDYAVDSDDAEGSGSGGGAGDAE